MIYYSYDNPDSVVLANHRHKNQWEQTKNPEIDPHTHGSPIFDEGASSVQWGDDSLFNQCERPTGCLYGRP